MGTRIARAGGGDAPSVFTEAELAYLRSERRLARLATVDPDGTPHVTRSGGPWTPRPPGSRSPGGTSPGTKKYRDVARTGRAAIVVDDVLPPWQPRGVEIRGQAEAIDGPTAAIHIHPERIVAWGVDQATRQRPAARDVPRTAP